VCPTHPLAPKTIAVDIVQRPMADTNRVMDVRRAGSSSLHEGHGDRDAWNMLCFVLLCRSAEGLLTVTPLHTLR
jgi:hypothetical protein